MDSRWSLASRGSVLSIASDGSVLSIGSVGLVRIRGIDRFGRLPAVDRLCGIGRLRALVRLPPARCSRRARDRPGGRIALAAATGAVVLILAARRAAGPEDE